MGRSRHVQADLARAIARGVVVLTYKTKAADLGGRQLVSVGPEIRAVHDGVRRYAVITKDGSHSHVSAVFAAQAFIDFVGRDVAWEALQRALAKRAK